MSIKTKSIYFYNIIYIIIQRVHSKFNVARLEYVQHELFSQLVQLVHGPRFSKLEQLGQRGLLEQFLLMVQHGRLVKDGFGLIHGETLSGWLPEGWLSDQRWRRLRKR